MGVDDRGLGYSVLVYGWYEIVVRDGGGYWFMQDTWDRVTGGE